MSQPSSPTPKKGLGTGAKIGIGCAGLVVLIIVGFIVVVFMLKGRIQNFAEEAQKNPTRATASLMVSTGIGEMVAEDDVNKRYTVKEKKSGALTTFYWNSKKNAADTVPGDFSAIPVEPTTTAPSPDSGAVPGTIEK